MAENARLRTTATAQHLGATALWQEYHEDRSDAARNRVIEHYLYLPKLFAEKMKNALPAAIDVQDLYQVGVIGLMDAVQKFDPERGVKFSTYAGKRIVGTIIDYLRVIDWVPRQTRGRQKVIEDLRREFLAEGKPEPDAHDIVKAVPPPVSALASAQAQSLRAWKQDIVTPSRMDSLEYLTASDEHDDQALAVLTDHRVPAPLDRLAISEVPDMLAVLLPRLRTVIELYYFKRWPMKKIGKALGLSESRVCQLHKQAIAVLRSHYFLSGEENKMAGQGRKRMDRSGFKAVYEKAKGDREAAAKLGVSFHTFYRWRTGEGLPPKGQRSAATVDDDAIRKAYAKHPTDTAAALALKMAQASFSRWARKLGLPAKNKRNQDTPAAKKKAAKKDTPAPRTIDMEKTEIEFRDETVKIRDNTDGLLGDPESVSKNPDALAVDAFTAGVMSTVDAVAEKILVEYHRVRLGGGIKQRPAGVFSKVGLRGQLHAHIDETLDRIEATGYETGKDDKNPLDDLLGYLVLLKIELEQSE